MNMDINKKFAKIDSNGAIVYAPRTLELDG